MTTPNIENIIKSLVVKAGVMEMGEKIAWGSDTALMRQAAAALQTQAERIKELEALICAASALTKTYCTPPLYAGITCPCCGRHSEKSHDN